MRIVVTGASGFVGARLVEWLMQTHVDVVAVSRQSRVGSVQVNDYGQTPGGDVLVHLAEDRDRGRVNAAGQVATDPQRRTMDTLLKKGFARVVYVSSAVLYGDASQAPHAPADASDAADWYARGKLAGEEAVLGAAGGVVARLANLYGPAMALNNVVSTILQQIGDSGPLQVQDDGPVRDFLWIDDAAEALAAMATAESSDPSSGLYNIGTGCGTSIGALARMALDIAGAEERPVVALCSSARESCIVLDSAVTTKVWGWRARTELRRGLTSLIHGS